MAYGPITSWQLEGEKVETVTNFILLGSQVTVNIDWSDEIKMTAPWKESYGKPRQLIKKQRHHFAEKHTYNQCYRFFQQSSMDVRVRP